MLTLKQAFSVAALQQNSRTQSQQCDSCPLQQLHKLCDRIEGETSTVCPITHSYHVLSLYQPIPLSYCIPLFVHLSEVLSNRPSSAHIHIYYQIFWYTKKIVNPTSTILLSLHTFLLNHKRRYFEKIFPLLFHTVTNTLLNVFERSLLCSLRLPNTIKTNILKHFILLVIIILIYFKKLFIFCGFISVVLFLQN